MSTEKPESHEHEYYVEATAWDDEMSTLFVRYECGNNGCDMPRFTRTLTIEEMG